MMKNERFHQNKHLSIKKKNFFPMFFSFFSPKNNILKKIPIYIENLSNSYMGLWYSVRIGGFLSVFLSTINSPFFKLDLRNYRTSF